MSQWYVVNVNVKSVLIHRAGRNASLVSRCIKMEILPNHAVEQVTVLQTA